MTHDDLSRQLDRIQAAGVVDIHEVPVGAVTVLAAMSDEELKTLAKIQRDLSATRKGDFGTIIF